MIDSKPDFMLFTDTLHVCTDPCILTYLGISLGCVSHKMPFSMCHHGLHMHSTFIVNPVSPLLRLAVNVNFDIDHSRHNTRGWHSDNLYSDPFYYLFLVKILTAKYLHWLFLGQEYNFGLIFDQANTSTPLTLH